MFIMKDYFFQKMKIVICFVSSKNFLYMSCSDATLDVITSNLMLSTHHLMLDVFADESDVKQSGCQK